MARAPQRQIRTTSGAAREILSKRPTTGARSGLRDGETRVTIVLSDDLNAVLHDWARASGRTWREVCMVMAMRYVTDVVGAWVKDGHRLRRKDGEPIPEAFADYYDDGPDEIAKYDPYFDKL